MGAACSVNDRTVPLKSSSNSGLSHREKLSMGQKLLTTDKLEDAIVWFRSDIFHRLDFTAFVLSGKWIRDVNLDDVKIIYDTNFLTEMKSSRHAYKFPQGSGNLLHSYIQRHSNRNNLMRLFAKEDTSKNSTVHSPNAKPTESEDDTADWDTLTPQSSQSNSSLGEIPDQFLPLLLTRLLPIYLKLCQIDLSTICDDISAHHRMPVDITFDATTFSVLQQEQLEYFQALNLRVEEILGIILTTSWIHKIHRVIETASLPLCICGVSSTSVNTSLHPVVYANSAYEALTGHSKSELIDESSGIFWDNERSEPEQVLAIKAALRSGLPLKVAVLNTRHNDTYVNMLALEPVCKARGYKYMLSVHYDLSEGGARQCVENDLHRVECLLRFVSETMCM